MSAVKAIQSMQDQRLHRMSGISYGGYGFPEYIGHNGVGNHLTYDENILETVLFTAFYTGQLITISGQFLENMGILV